MSVSNSIRTARNLSLVTGRPAAYELARRLAANRIFGIRSIDHYLNYQFYDKKLSMWRDYMDNSEKRVLQFQAIPPGSLELTSNKAAFAKRCAESNIPTPTTKCFYSRTSIDANPGVDTVRDESTFDDYIRSFHDGSYLMKPISGRHGDGVVKFDVRQGTLIDDHGRDTTVKRLVEGSLSNPYGDSGLIVQEFIRPHRDLQPIMNGPGLGTIRFMTLRSPNGKVRIPWAILKLPLHGSITDNFSSGKSGNLIAALDVESGRILRAIGNNPANGFLEEMTEHPETNTILPGHSLPAWRETLKNVLAAAVAFDEFPSLGWDVAISKEGPVFIEMNAYWCCELIQIAYGRGIKSEVLNHYALFGIDLSRYDEIRAYLRTDEGRAAVRGR
jgi:hypothetical protein